MTTIGRKRDPSGLYKYAREIDEMVTASNVATSLKGYADIVVPNPDKYPF